MVVGLFENFKKRDQCGGMTEAYQQQARPHQAVNSLFDGVAPPSATRRGVEDGKNEIENA